MGNHSRDLRIGSQLETQRSVEVIDADIASGESVQVIVDVAHIVMDADEQHGQPVVTNGLPLTITKLPGRQDDQGVHVSELLALLYWPAGHASHTRSIVVEPGAETNCPALQTLSGAHVVLRLVLLRSALVCCNVTPGFNRAMAESE